MPATRSLTIGRLREDGQRFMEEVSREYYLAHSGHKANAELQPIYEKYAHVSNDDAFGLVLERFRAAPPASEEFRSARMLLEWLLESRVSRTLAATDEREIEWEGSAILTLDDGRQLPYQRAAIEIANSTDRAERLRIERARAKLVAKELAPLRRERFVIEKDETESVGIGEAAKVGSGYNATFEALSGVNLLGLRDECLQFLRDTQPMWDDVFREFVSKGLGIAPSEATRADALALLRAREFDDAFDGGKMDETIRRQVSEMGIDPLAGGRVILDVGERPGKRARAFCAPVEIPAEVYLVLRPHGGQTDWSTYLHELGHAMHFAYMRAELPFEYRWIGDNSITEGYAMLFDHLMQSPHWLQRYTGMNGERTRAFLRAAGFEELQFLRRYCAKLAYEVQLYSGDVPWDALPDLYVTTLTDATNFKYDAADAFVDVDPRFYSVRYLRAWQLQSVITETLVDQFNEDWFRNPKAGPWVVGQLFGEGQRELAGEQAQRIAGKKISFAPLVRSIERMLG